ncbi:MAG: transglutaminase domain-containing protein [Pseudonocardia sp.]|nr:transglutaminase domain-containing protein [Pseudonocardia sp.]
MNWPRPRWAKPRWDSLTRAQAAGMPALGVPVAAAASVAAGSTALTAALSGWRWLWLVLLTVGLMMLIGLIGRATNASLGGVLGAQTLGLALLLVMLFSDQRSLGVLPGPSAITELVDQLASVGNQIANGIPPVPTTTSLLLLVCLVLGVMAIVVDVLAAAGHGPAASGLALLCSYTVPTTMVRDALPDWTLVVGALSYAMLLMVQHQRRQAGWAQRPPTVAGPRSTARPGLARRLLGWGRSVAARYAGLPIGLAICAVSLSAALLVGTFATAVGTAGRFTGDGVDVSSGVQFGLTPFTSLRGQLRQPVPTELLRVRGLPEATYLRAVVLNRYVSQQGWQLPLRRRGVKLDRTLPTGLATPIATRPTVIEFENVGYRDRWLPLYGLPIGVTQVSPGRWHYDLATTTAYTDGPIAEQHWTERAVLVNPQVGVLQDTLPTTDVDPIYLDTDGVDRRIGQLAASLTSRAHTPFAKVVALTRYFLDPSNGFRYSLRTAPGNTGDLLLDFLVRSKVGYCEQFASAMAVMLRTVGVPARLAIGFAPGRQADGYRSIATSDAHAWVEAFFPGQGWLTFDPTPRDNSHGVVPDYLANAPKAPVVPSRPEQQPSSPEPNLDPSQDAANPPPSPGSPAASQRTGSGKQANDNPGPGRDRPGNSPESPANPAQRTALLVILALVGMVSLIGAPFTVRRLARRRRLALAAHGGCEGAVAAWRELLAESRDCGGQLPGNLTVRAAGHRIVSAHRLHDASSNAVRTVVTALERGWYAPSADPNSGPNLVDALRMIRHCLRRSTSLTLTERLWPRSVRPRLRTRRPLHGGTGHPR